MDLFSIFLVSSKKALTDRHQDQILGKDTLLTEPHILTDIAPHKKTLDFLKTGEKTQTMSTIREYLLYSTYQSRLDLGKELEYSNHIIITIYLKMKIFLNDTKQFIMRGLTVIRQEQWKKAHQKKVTK